MVRWAIPYRGNRAYYAGKSPVIAFCGDGGLQMNIQEMQVLSRERLPVKIVLLNNYSLA
jgi:acetolactate synthase-1/2/3 large subunit